MLREHSRGKRKDLHETLNIVDYIGRCPNSNPVSDQLESKVGKDEDGKQERRMMGWADENSSRGGAHKRHGNCSGRDKR